MADRPPFNNGSSLVAMAHQDREQRERITELEDAIRAHLVRNFGRDWDFRCRLYDVDSDFAQLADALKRSKD